MPMKMIIDTDPGVDDAMAILYAARTPEIDLLGLTTVFGNVPIHIATRNALRLAEMAGLDIPVAEGAAAPLVRDFVPSSRVHGAEGFGAVPALNPQREALRETAADFLCRMARDHRGEMTICAIGPITNVAEAIRRDPDFVRNVRKIVFMGGAAHVPGNITPHAEANIYHDPHALTEVLASGASVTMVGLDVTMQVLCNAEDFAALAVADPEHGGFLRDASVHYLDFYREIGQPGCGLHDPAAVIACHRPDLFETRPIQIHVVENGVEAGRTRPEAMGTVPAIEVCLGGQMDEVKALFLAAFAAGPDVG
ncbi:nucleoside hydrolase [Palleronia aestuarii]